MAIRIHGIEEQTCVEAQFIRPAAVADLPLDPMITAALMGGVLGVFGFVNVLSMSRSASTPRG